MGRKIGVRSLINNAVKKVNEKEYIIFLKRPSLISKTNFFFFQSTKCRQGTQVTVVVSVFLLPPLYKEEETSILFTVLRLVLVTSYRLFIKLCGTFSPFYESRLYIKGPLCKNIELVPFKKKKQKFIFVNKNLRVDTELQSSYRKTILYWSCNVLHIEETQVQDLQLSQLNVTVFVQTEIHNDLSKPLDMRHDKIYNLP